MTPTEISASRVLRNLQGSAGVAFHCPACHTAHDVILVGPEPHHHLDGTPDHPTFWPAINVATATMFGEDRCHSFITIGQISFQPDCTHALAGKQVPMPHWPESTRST